MSNSVIYSCHKISEGTGEGDVLFSTDGMCFYLVDPETGIVIEKNHPLYGQSIANKVLVFPNGKGSSVVQADGMYQLKMHGNAPSAMIIQNPDTTLVASAIILDMPLVDRVSDEFYSKVSDADHLVVNATEGRIFN